MHWLLRRVRVSPLFLLLALSLPAHATCTAATATATAASASASTLTTLGIYNLAAAAAMVATFGGLALYRMGLSTLAQTLMVSASRCAIQVFVLGSVVLQRLLGTTRPWLVGLWIASVGLVAGKEAFSRVQYTYPHMRRHVHVSVLTGTLSVLVTALLLSVFGRLSPWYQPRTLIPVAGMLFGNTLTAAALAASGITKKIATHQEMVEWRLVRGATAQEAILPLVQDTMNTALTPTLNGLAVTGIVHIPGMMTGQILAGQSPPQAAAYQIMINLLIATTACATVQLLVHRVTSSLVDHTNHRLYGDRLTSKEQTRTQPTSSNTFKWNVKILASSRRLFGTRSRSLYAKHSKESKDIPPAPQSVQITNAPLSNANATLMDRQGGSSPVLEIQELPIARVVGANLTLQLFAGERIGISGFSGIGKSQVLRTLVGLEASDLGCVKLYESSLLQTSWPQVRTQICLVPQNRPNLEGTPRQFYQEIQQLEHQRHRLLPISDNNLEQQEQHLPWEIAKHWRLDESTWDKPWPTLSSGEAQRVSLAMALASQPQVMLLDESTSALDESTCRLVEDTLIQSCIPMVVVTHSQEQLDRFCTHQMKMTTSAG